MKEQIRLAVLTLAAIAGGIFGSSGYIRRGVQFIQFLTSPDVWDRVFELYEGEAAKPRPSGGPALAPGVHAGSGADPFGFLEGLAAESELKNSLIKDNERRERMESEKARPEGLPGDSKLTLIGKIEKKAAGE